MSRVSTSINFDRHAERLFHRLSAGGQVDVPLQDMFWGATFGSLNDRFGAHWMVNCNSER